MTKNRLNPHDRFAKAMMTNKKVIQEFFQLHLPETIKNKIDFSSITPQKDSFIDDKLRLQVADLLYKVQINNETGFFYLLLEHQSTPDKLMPFRMLKYMIAIMEQHLKKTKGDKLPFIYPLILYSGEKPYPYSLNLFDLFETEKELAQETLFNPYHLIDLTQVSDEELKRYIWFGTMGLLLKHVHDADILPVLKGHLQVFRNLEKEGEEEYIYTILSYVVEAAEVSSKEEFMKTIKQLESVNEEKIMTIAEQFRQEGFKKASHEIALSMIKKGISVSTVSEVTGLSSSQIESLKKQIH